MPDPKSRARVERIIGGGDFRPDDVKDLFTYLRFHCDGRETVRDVGHFIAHHDARDRGIVTRSAQDFCHVVRFHMSRFPFGKPQIPHFEAKKLPASAKDYFKSAVNRLDTETLKKIGWRRPDAYAVAHDVSDRFIRNADDTWALPPVTKKELTLLEWLATYMVVKPAFTAEQLSADFIAVLKSNGLITREEMREHKETLSAIVQLTAVAAMHNCTVVLADGTTAQLKGQVSKKHKNIGIFASFSAQHPRVLFGCAMFSATLEPGIYCHQALISEQSWDFEVELDPSKKLVPFPLEAQFPKPLAAGEHDQPPDSTPPPDVQAP